MRTKKDPVITAAIKWWKMRRPCSWNEVEHLDMPKVNCVTTAEANLATAVARHIKRTKNAARP